ncbi:MAG: hypothetical protein CMO32_13320 [Variovorax sp.]|jgi:signal transduction histidine kinase|nr:hypothetical protein [Variovorax sp.]
MPDLLSNGDAQLASPMPPPVAGCDEQAAAPSMDRLMDAAMHGVRNSLSAIRLGVDLLARRGDLNEADAVLEHIDSAAVRAHEQAEELADFCRLAAGRTIATVAKRFPLHHVVRQALEARHSAQPGGVEHDRLGHGDCLGDPVRVAQFMRLALEELAPRAASRCIVISEIDGPRFRIAVHAGDPKAHEAADTPGQRLARAHRQALLRAIAHAHGGELRLASGPPHGWSVEGRFAGAG